MKQNTKMRVMGLEQFELNETSFRLLGNRNVRAYVHLQSYDVTPAVRRLRPSRRFSYLSRRVDRWLESLYRRHPQLSFEVKAGKLAENRTRPSAELPVTLAVSCSAREALEIARGAGVRSVYVVRVAGRRCRRSPKPPLEWYCVRALVVIRVERAASGLQAIEDRFMLVRASSFEDAKKRLQRQWREYATPYLNSDGQMVSWQLDHVIDVYETGETEINPDGAEAYSKLSSRRMRAEYIWRPGPKGKVYQV
jgi:hypothetical protein